MLKKQDLPPDVLEGTRDPWGRTVRLKESAMRHIAKRHPELEGCEMPITTAVENAFERSRTRHDGREILWAANLGPAAWLAVVIAYDGEIGEVITAYGNKKGPKSEDRI